MSTETRLSVEEQATNFVTMQHIQLVQHHLHIIIKHLLDRGEQHDASKLAPPEVEAFTAETKNLSGLTYGTPAYYANLERIKPALDHHYARNRHHSEHFARGIDDMNLVDIVEMFSDWAASCQRHKDGNLRTSIEKNADRYSMSPQLVKILENSMELFE